MATGESGLESLLSTASESEAEFDWRGAAEAYSKATAVAPAGDALQLGVLEESAAHALYRHAFQAETREEFEGRVAKARDQYAKAKVVLGRSEGDSHIPWSRRCDAMIAFLSAWPIEDPAEKRRFAQESWTRAKEAMDAFEREGDRRQLRSTNNLLAVSVSIVYAYSKDPGLRESLLREGLKYSEKAMDAPLEEGDKRDASVALVSASNFTMLLCTDFVDPAHQVEWDRRAGELFRKGLSMSREGCVEALSFTYRYGMFPSTLTEEETAELRDDTLQYARRTRDLLRMACATEWMISRPVINANETVDPDERDSFMDEALRYVEEVNRYLSTASSTYLSDAVMWPGAPRSGYYTLKASLETDLGKKKVLAEKAVAASEEGLRLAERCGFPEVISSMHDDAAQALFNLAKSETDLDKKKRVLGLARDHGRRSMEIWKSVHAAEIGTVIMRSSFADIEHELSELADDAKEKVRLCRAAIALMTEAYEGLTKLQDFASSVIGRWSRLKLGVYRYKIADWSYQLYETSKKKEDLVLAAKAFQEAAELYRKPDQPSRAAESHWRAAQALDALGDYSGSSDRFAEASDAYNLAIGRVPRLAKMYHDYDLYMQAWSQIELARRHHARLETMAASECYKRAADLHESTERWQHLALNYKAWSEVERGEDLSRREMGEDASKAFAEAARMFEEVQDSIAGYLERMHDRDEKDNSAKLSDAAGLRKEYCEGRVELEEARLLDKRGDELASYDRYGRAIEVFERLQTMLESDRDRREMQLITTLTRAWQTMAKAETEASPELYEEASARFEEAKDLSIGEKAKLTALGHSRFCRALAAGTRFADTGDQSLHATATKNLDSAAKHYLKAGLENDSEYAKASRRLFDAYVYMNQASNENDQAKRARLYAMTEKVLETSAESYSKAGYTKKSNQVRKLLKEARDERELAVTLTEVLHAPDALASTSALPTPSPTHESAVGMQRFEHADVQATLFAKPRELHVGQNLRVDIELVNAGKGAAQLMKVDGIVPEGFDVVAEPATCRIEDHCVILRGRRLDALKTDDVNILLRPSRKGSFELTPRIMYLDESGKYRFQEPDPIHISVKELGISGWLKGPER